MTSVDEVWPEMISSLVKDLSWLRRQILQFFKGPPARGTGLYLN